MAVGIAVMNAVEYVWKVLFQPTPRYRLQDGLAACYYMEFVMTSLFEFLKNLEDHQIDGQTSVLLKESSENLQHGFFDMHTNLH